MSDDARCLFALQNLVRSERLRTRARRRAHSRNGQQVAAAARAAADGSK